MLYAGGSLAGDCRIKCVPPFRIILKPAGKPCEDGILPAAALVVVKYVMILILDCHESRRTAKKFERRKHLYALSDRHIHILVAMEEKQRSVDLVGSEKGALVDIQILACPRIRTSHRHLAVGIAQ